MAYTSRYPAKRRSKAGTKAHKKKPGGRVAKKGGSAGSTKLKIIIVGEVAKALNSGAQNERRKVTMCLSLPEKRIFVNSKESLNNCIRIPITDAIPAQAGAGQGPDVRRLRANKVVVTGVNVRASAHPVEMQKTPFSAVVFEHGVMRTFEFEIYIHNEIALLMVLISQSPLSNALLLRRVEQCSTAKTK
ncbi:MAG: hypothetical protein LQ341_002240 [Variospora aurantia]|nr:MAG: hypothetical protein LQ341_002240 [Variospora aurantia]